MYFMCIAFVNSRMYINVKIRAMKNTTISGYDILLRTKPFGQILVLSSSLDWEKYPYQPLTLTMKNIRRFQIS